MKIFLSEYLFELGVVECTPLKLAYHIDGSDLFIWAEIRTDDEISEDQLLVVAAKLNAKYHDKGFHIESTIIEDYYFIPVPQQFKMVIP